MFTQKWGPGKQRRCNRLLMKQSEELETVCSGGEEVKALRGEASASLHKSGAPAAPEPSGGVSNRATWPATPRLELWPWFSVCSGTFSKHQFNVESHQTSAFHYSEGGALHPTAVRNIRCVCAHQCFDLQRG